MMPSPPHRNIAYFFIGAGGHCVGKYWSYGLVYFDLGDGGMRVTVLFFRPQGTYVPCI